MGKPGKKPSAGYHVLIGKVTAGSHKLRLEFELIGTIHSMSVDVSGELIKNSEAEMRQIKARQ